MKLAEKLKRCGLVRGRYVGPDDRLRAKTALLRMTGPAAASVQAQFDDRSLPQAYGWHEFPRHQFKIQINTRVQSCT